jgi:hypothetical protein
VPAKRRQKQHGKSGYVRKVEPHLPIQPLLDLLGPFHPLPKDGQSSSQTSTVPFAERVGVSRRQVVRWQARGTLAWYDADKAACAYGLHPSYVWGDQWDEIASWLGPVEPKGWRWDDDYRVRRGTCSDACRCV